MKVLVSACLLGMPCRYDAQAKRSDAVCQLNYDWLPICPEVMGGLTTPRPPAEIQANRVVTQAGDDVTAEYLAGAQMALALAKQHQVELAILKARSPSCGVGQIYDGTFQSRLVAGDGLTAQLLRQAGLKLITEEEVDGNLDCSLESRGSTSQALADS